MKTREIVVNEVYSNGKGRVRKVIAEGVFRWNAAYLYDPDYVRYEIIADGQKVGSEVGKKIDMTRNGFAKWAKERIS